MNNADFLEKLHVGYEHLKNIANISYYSSMRTLVYNQKNIKLYHYETTKKQAPTLLIVFSLVNKPDILDLTAQVSFINELVKKGMNVYLLDWSESCCHEQSLSMADYVLNFLAYAITTIKQREKVDKINLLGICQGGLMTLSYAALHHDVAKLILISTPIDFHTKDNLIAKLAKNIQFSESHHAIPGKWLTQFFLSLNPFDLISKKYLAFLDRLEDPIFTDKFLRIEKWLHDVPDHPALVFKEMLQALYQENKLVKGEWEMAGKRIDCRALSMPVLNIIARNDTIVPKSASIYLKKLISPHLYQQKILPSGHIGLYVSDNTSKQLPKSIASFLEKC